MQLIKEQENLYAAWKAEEGKRRGREISAAMAMKVRRGGLPGQARLGYVNSRRYGESLVEVDLNAAALVQRAFYMAEEPGASLRAILADVTKRGLRSRHGKPLGVSALWKVLTDPLYMGMILYKGELIRGAHQPLVTRECFRKVQENLAARRRR
jgi:site-specific DNA recombinase